IPDLVDGVFQIFESANLSERRDRHSVFQKKCLFAKPVLRCKKNFAFWMNLGKFGRGLDRRERNVFEVERDDIETTCKITTGVNIAVGGDNFALGGLSGRRVGRRRKRVHAIAHLARLEREHTAELAAAENAYGRIGQYGHRGYPSNYRSVFKTVSVCVRRNCSSFSRSSLREFARIATARSAAFFAPASPIASVPTGIPAGICTIERSESMPLSARLSIGTPSTGSVVCDAHMPGR